MIQTVKYTAVIEIQKNLQNKMVQIWSILNISSGRRRGVSNDKINWVVNTFQHSFMVKMSRNCTRVYGKSPFVPLSHHFDFFSWEVLGGQGQEAVKLNCVGMNGEVGRVVWDYVKSEQYDRRVLKRFIEVVRGWKGLWEDGRVFERLGEAE